MPDQAPGSFEQAVEKDIERLSAEVKLNREHPEMKSLSGQELLKHSLRSMSGTQAPAPADDDGGAGSVNVLQNPLPAYAESASPETKLEIEHLLEIAFREGIAKANAEASKSNPFVLDAFHDALAGKLYPELKRRNIVD